MAGKAYYELKLSYISQAQVENLLSPKKISTHFLVDSALPSAKISLEVKKLGDICLWDL